MLQGKLLVLYRTFVSLRSHISASIEKFGSQLWNVANETLVAYTDLFVSLVHSRFNSLNDILVITKTKCITPFVFSRIVIIYILVLGYTFSINLFSYIIPCCRITDFQFHLPLCTYCLPCTWVQATSSLFIFIWATLKRGTTEWRNGEK